MKKTIRLPADPASIARAAEILREGGLVAFPTETVYGLGARADDAEAVLGVFRAKGRPAGNPLIVHCASARDAASLSQSWPEDAERLAAAFWPGPLTLVVARRPERVAAEAAAFGPTVAVRVPAHPIARALLDACGLPVAAPSANRSTSISPTTADHVMKTLDGRIAMVLDGGPTGHGIESTIIDVTTSPATVLRLGAIPLAAIEAVVPLISRADAVTAPSERAASPGTHARHYAPRARVLMVPREALVREVLALRASGEVTGAITTELSFGGAAENASGNTGGDASGNASENAAGNASGRAAGDMAMLFAGPIEILPADPVGYAAGLYAALHRLEDAACVTIVIAEVPSVPAWAAVRDRLRRASAPE